MDFHPVANIFPLMSGQEYEELKADIAKHGQREPIWTHEGHIVDGRNRYNACTELGIKPIVQAWGGEGSLVAFVMSLNLHRRHLTASQKAAIAATIKPMFEEEARERMTSGVNQHTSPVEIFPQGYAGKSRDQAAAVTGANPRYVSDYEKIERETPDLAEPIREGKINIPTAKVLAEVAPEERTLILSGNESEVKQAVEQIKKAHVSHNSGNNEWYTPDEFLSLARQVMGSIDLDPASSEIANERVNAGVFYTQDDDGLTKDWFGNVWMNPPYESGLIGKFAEKLAEEYEQGNIESAIVLVNNATETAWFKTMVQNASAVCFPHSRIRFISPDGKLGAPLQGQAIIYLGDSAKLFADTFQTVGWCAHVC